MLQLGFHRNWFVALDWGVFYFRLAGYGLWVASYKRQPMGFSERYGYEKVWKVGGSRCEVCKNHSGWRVKRLDRSETMTGPWAK